MEHRQSRETATASNTFAHAAGKVSEPREMICMSSAWIVTSRSNRKIKRFNKLQKLLAGGNHPPAKNMLIYALIKRFKAGRAKPSLYKRQYGMKLISILILKEKNAVGWKKSN